MMNGKGGMGSQAPQEPPLATPLVGMKSKCVTIQNAKDPEQKFHVALFNVKGGSLF